MSDLCAVKDEKIVSFIQNNIDVEENLNELIKRHSGICINMINNYMSRKSYPSLRDDLIKDKDLHIYQAALKFDFNKKVKFSTHLGNEVKWKCLNTYNKFKKNQTVIFEDSMLDFLNFNQSDISSEKDEDVFSEIINLANSHPDKRVKKIFYLRYVVGKNNSVMPWKNVSNQLGMSIQGCINIHNAAIKNLKYKIK